MVPTRVTPSLGMANTGLWSAGCRKDTARVRGNRWTGKTRWLPRSLRNRLLSQASHQRFLAGNTHDQEAAPRSNAQQVQAPARQMGQARPAGERQGGLGLQGVAESQQRKLDPGLGQPSHRLQAGLPVGEEHAIEAFDLRERGDVYRGPRDNAETPFAPQDDLTQVWPGCAGRMGRQFHWPNRCLQVPTQEQVFDAPVIIGLLSARAVAIQPPRVEYSKDSGKWLRV